MKLVDDVLPHRLGRGRREGVEGGFGKLVAERGELAVLRAKVVTPVADAMGLVDRERAHAQFAKEGLGALGDDPFG